MSHAVVADGRRRLRALRVVEVQRTPEEESFGAADKGVHPAGAAGAREKWGEDGWVAGYRGLLEGVHRGRKGGFEGPGGFGGGLVGVGVKELAGVEERFGKAFVPEGVLDSQWDEWHFGEAQGESGKSGLECEGKVAGVGEAALRGEPENAIPAEDGFGGAEKLDGSAG